MPETESAVDDCYAEGATFIPCHNAGDDADEPYIDGPLSRSEFDLPDGPLLRFQAYRKAWEGCLCKIKEIVHALHSPVVHAVVDSVQSAYTKSDEHVVLPFHELVCLVVSSSDRTNLHEVLLQISSSLFEKDSQDETQSDRIPTAFVSNLAELDCSNVATTMRSLITAFISQPFRNSAPAKMKPVSSLAMYDIKILTAWYQALKEEYGAKVPALVVLIHDLHIIEPCVLQDVLEICSLHLQCLPLVFVLGTSDPQQLHSVLPRSVLTCLRIERYVLSWDIQALEHVIRETFFSPKYTPDVMLGPVGFRMIFDEFKKNNATLDAVLSTIQLLHMQHFYHPLSLLVDSDSDVTLLNVQNKFPNDWIRFLKLLRQYCIPALFDKQDDQDTPKWSDITPQEVIGTVLDARSTFRALQIQMKVALSVLDTIWSFVRGHGKTTSTMNFEEMGLLALRGSLNSSSARDIPTVVKRLGLNEATALMEALYHLVHSLPAGARGSATELKQKVVVVKNDMTEDTLTDFVDFLQAYFRRAFISFEDIVCLDLWWTGETNIPHSALNPNLRMSIVTALLEPQGYLGWNIPSTLRHDGELSSFPDACILFRRYVESGRMINVYDWYDSFSMTLEGETSKRDDGYTMDVDLSPSKGKGKKEAQKRKQLEEREEEYRVSQKREIQARFMRSMHELDFVGFLKHTGRKADHVVKTALDVLG